jgi:dolichol-phosphate mannosyltransferase
LIKVIFAALNEEENLPKLIADISNSFNYINISYQIIICIDSSSDKSFEILLELAKKYPIKILEFKNQRGLGLAFKRLIKEAAINSEDQDLVISLDADNSHACSQIQEMVKYFNDNKLDFLVASRFCSASSSKGFPLYRQLISKSVSILLQTLFPIIKKSGGKLKDYTSGFRIYSSRILKKSLEIYGDDYIKEPEFTYTCEFLIKLARIKAAIDETPISYNYDQKIGKSKLKIGKNFLRLIILIFNLKTSKSLKILQTELI